MVGGIQVSGTLRTRAALPFLPIDCRTRDFQDYAGLRQKPYLLDSILLILLILSSFRRARPIIGGALPANRNLRRRVATCARAVRR